MGMMGPKNVFDHCAQMVRTTKLKLHEHQKSYFLFTRLAGVTTATSLSGSTQDFLKLLFHMFPYNEISKVFKSKI